MKVLYIDVETTGLDFIDNDIIQLSGIIEVDEVILETFDFKIKPFNFSSISKDALIVNGFSLELCKSFPDPMKVYEEFKNILNKYVDRFNKRDKFYVCGYNVHFDLNFLDYFFRKNNDVFFYAYCNRKYLDPLPILYFLDYKNRICLNNYRLETVCRYFNINIKAHDSLSDVRATYKLLKKLRDF